MVEILKLEECDLEFLNKVRNQCAPEFLHDSRLFTLEETVKWFTETNPNYYLIKDDINKLGYFRTSNLDRDNRSIYVGCDIDEKYRGMGYGFYAYTKFIPFIFKEYDVDVILLEVLENNTAAKNLYLKLGFVHLKDMEDKIKKSCGYITSQLMSINRNQWLH